MVDVNPMATRKVRKDYEHAPRVRAAHLEDPVTRLFEQQMVRVPSAVFLAAALAALTGSVLLDLSGRPRAGRCLGLLPPTLLMFGLYNKLVKVLGTH